MARQCPSSATKLGPPVAYSVPHLVDANGQNLRPCKGNDDEECRRCRFPEPVQGQLLLHGASETLLQLSDRDGAPIKCLQAFPSTSGFGPTRVAVYNTGLDHTSVTPKPFQIFQTNRTLDPTGDSTFVYDVDPCAKSSPRCVMLPPKQTATNL